MGHFAHCYADFFGIPYLKQVQKSAAKWVPGKGWPYGGRRGVLIAEVGSNRRGT